MSLSEIICERKENLRVSIRKKDMRRQLQEARSRFMHRIEMMSLDESLGFVNCLNKIWGLVQRHDLPQLVDVVALIHSKRDLVGDVFMREEIRRHNLVSILFQCLESKVFHFQVEAQILQFLQKISTHWDMADQVLPHTHLLTRRIREGSFFEDATYILSNLLYSDVGVEVCKVLIRQQVTELIAHNIEHSLCVKLWMYFMTIYLQRLQEFRIEGHRQSIDRIITYIKKVYLEERMEPEIQGEVEMFLCKTGYQFGENNINCRVVRKLILKSSEVSLDALLVMVHRERWIVGSKIDNIDRLVSNLLEDSIPLQKVKLSVLTMSVILRKTKNEQFTHYITTLLGMERLLFLVTNQKYESCGLDRLVMAIVETLRDVGPNYGYFHEMVQCGHLSRHSRLTISDQLQRGVAHR